MIVRQSFEVDYLVYLIPASGSERRFQVTIIRKLSRGVGELTYEKIVRSVESGTNFSEKISRLHNIESTSWQRTAH